MPAEQPSDRGICRVGTQSKSEVPAPGTHRRHTFGSVPPELDDGAAALEALHQGIEPVDGLVRPVLEEAAVPGQREGDAVVAGPLGDLTDVAPGGHQDGHEAVPQAVEGEAVEASALD